MHWCMLFIYGQPVIQLGSESGALIIGEDHQKVVIDDLSRLEEYVFTARSAITISLWRNDHG